MFSKHSKVDKNQIRESHEKIGNDLDYKKKNVFNETRVTMQIYCN